ncbi:LAME_0H01574g1_1 [Lachancea meyersii CBS 8951]|uniref:LAME_0H01574g1_1 n=1 Tax=Lachancea meyersii CBS 8951 TaxID=1266667 RepID=A0A1G4KDD3_9SACH|nr:LAME_0H01574g1_1 [Lachancea meyersii CBS 8951]
MSANECSVSDENLGLEPSTVDTLLSEIEREIPVIAKRQLPLHEIGDETMDKIVSYNTRSNSNLSSSTSGEGDDCDLTEQPLSSSQNRKSVMFSDKFELHEYSSIEISAVNNQPNDTGKTNVAWDHSSLPKANPTATAAFSSKRDSQQDDQDDSSSNGSERSLLLTEEELKSNSVTNLYDKLDLVLGNKPGSPNVPKLKEMINHVDQLAFDSSKDRTMDTQPLRITFESTPPLNGNSAQHQLLEYEIQSQDSDEEVFPQVQHSPSKIPTTNTIRINRLANSESEGISGPSRVSSGSSMDESVTDLETTMRQDKFNFLRTSIPHTASGAPPVVSEFHMSNRSLELREASCNDSRVFSMATTADEFQSARESTSSSWSTDESQGFQAIEDLQISQGLVREEETLKNINEITTLDEYRRKDLSDSIYSKGLRLPTPLSDIFNEDLVKSPSSSTVNVSALQEANYNQSTGNDTFDDKQVGNQSIGSEIIDEKQANIPDSNYNEANDKENDNSELAVGGEPEECAQGPNDVTKNDEETESISVDDKSEAIEEIHTEEKVALNEEQVTEDLLKETRIISNNLGNLFDDDAVFADIGDTSQDSVDITYALKPTYLSIWHSQEGSIKTSPTISSNSQFSHQSNTTGESSNSVQSNFKLKPRIVSRSKIYYPRTRKRQDSKTLLPFSSQDNSSNALDPRRSQWLQRVRPNTFSQESHQKQVPSIARIALAYDETEAKKHRDSEGESQTAVPEREENLDCELAMSNDVAEHSMTGIGNSRKSSQVFDTSLEIPKALGEGLDLLEDFDDLLKTLSSDNMSFKGPTGQRKGNPVVYHIWGEDNYQNAAELSFGEDDIDARTTEKVLNDKILTKLLSFDSKAEQEEPEQSKKIGLGILKTADSDVAVYQCDSFKGFEVVRSASTESFEQFQGTQSPSPVKSTHVESPFKAVRAKKLDCAWGESMEAAAPLKMDLEPEMLQTALEPTRRSSIKSAGIFEKSDGHEVRDYGKLYILVKSIKNLTLDDIARHKAEIAIEFDNGINVVQTPWTHLDKDSLELNEEYELVMKNITPTVSAQITLKCRYQKPSSRLVEVVERIPIKKKFPFGKPKYTLQKKFVQQKIDVDNWDYTFAQDGSFARCKLPLDKETLEQYSFRRKDFSFPLYNEWGREHSEVDPKKDVHTLPRKSAYQIGELNLEMCFLSRTSDLEKFPKTLKLAQGVVDKFAEQQKISFEGFLWQEGGDVDGLLRKRWFVLKGTQLIAHHEITRKPQALINLLKVVSVVGEGQLTEEAAKKVRNFTDMVLFSECFKLIFENGEIINLDAESTELKANWTNLITRVVELNKFHQPWVKHVLNNKLLNL